MIDLGSIAACTPTSMSCMPSAGRATAGRCCRSRRWSLTAWATDDCRCRRVAGGVATKGQFQFRPPPMPARSSTGWIAPPVS